ncbi:hypothetical protein [Nostoc sp. NMS7]|nr:hypothetical protein [Nostoc sp. NMS7]
MILPECGRDGLRPAGGDRSSNNVAIARRTDKRAIHGRMPGAG